MTNDYTDIAIRLRPIVEGSEGYEAEATVKSVRAKESFDFINGLLRLNLAELPDVRLNPEDYGMKLFYSLFAGTIREAYDQAISMARSETDSRLRIRIKIDDGAAELHPIRWEALHYFSGRQNAPLSTNSTTPFSRFTVLPLQSAEPVQRPIKMLFAIANPSNLNEYDLTPIDVTAEARSLMTAIRELSRTRQLALSIMPGWTGLPQELLNEFADVLESKEDLISGPTSLTNLKKHLPGFHVLHILAHGAFNRKESRARLFLESDKAGQEGSSKGENEGVVAQALSGIESLRLVFLAACESATGDGYDPHLGLAPKLVQAGVPSVIAMQDKIEMIAARKLTQEFYSNLFLHGLVDRALNQARNVILDEKNAIWTVPILFMRQAGGQIFRADPVRAALESIHREGYMAMRPLPIEVAHLIAPQQPGNLIHFTDGKIPGLDLLDAIDSILLGRAGDSVQAKTLSQQEEEEVQNEGQALEEKPKEKDTAKFILLMGWPGSAKSAQLRTIARHTAKNSLTPGCLQRVIPVFVKLEEFSLTTAGSGNRIESLAFKSLEKHWRGLTEENFRERLEGKVDNTIFRFLLDGSDTLTREQRHMAWESIGNFVKEYPLQQCILSLNRRFYDLTKLEKATDLLVVQPLSRRNIKRYLMDLASEESKALFEALEDHSLFDLAASPWLLFKMLEHAEDGKIPQSRSAVLEDVFQEMLARKVSRGDDQRQWAEQTLYTLAYEMHQRRIIIWNERRAFECMAGVREYREYRLDRLYADLVSCGLLSRVAPDSVQFSRQGLQAYCCAKAIATMDPDAREKVIDDITASLGRLTRLRWWEHVLILLSGLMENPNELLRAIAFGVDMNEGEQVFVMARCLLENTPERVSSTIRNYVINALIWRLSAGAERWIERRALAAELLGNLQATLAVDNLAQVALGIVEGEAGMTGTGDEGSIGTEVSTDDSFVRMRSAQALAEMMNTQDQKLREIRDAYVKKGDLIAAKIYDVLVLWRDKDEKALIKTIRDPEEDPGICAVTAYALGDINSPEAKKFLFQAFLERELHGSLRWAITDALTMLETDEITTKAIMPLLDKSAADSSELNGETWQHRTEWYEYLAYLVGRIGVQDPIILQFLGDNVRQPINVHVMTKSIEALGRLFARSFQSKFEEIAKGESLGSLKLNDFEKIELQKTAIEALGNIGVRGTISRLQKAHDIWPPVLERALYLASEEIDWRLNYSPRR